MSVKSEAELQQLKIIGRIVRNTLDRMAAAARSGMTTAELDEFGRRLLTEAGAEPAPAKVYGFPGAVCISVNNEAVHGVPGNRVLQDGDLLKLDLVACRDGFFADAAVTVPIGKVSHTAEALRRCAEAAFWNALKVARLGYRTCHIGREVQREVVGRGFNVMPGLGGHGVGRTIHEDPEVPNFYDRRCRTKLSEGMVLAVEPVIAAGAGRETLLADGWTIGTADGSLSAHYEHTIMITRGDPILLTA